MLRAGGATSLALLGAAACTPGPERQLATPGGRYPVAAVLADSPDHKRLSAALTRAGLAQELNRTDPAAPTFTIFAPTDAALAAVPGFDQLEPARQTAALRGLIARGRLLRSDIAARGGVITMLDGSQVRVAEGGAQVVRVAPGAGVTGATLASTGAAGTGPAATITRPDLLASNGVIHVVDRILI